MLFLDIAEILHNVGNAVIQACRTVCGWICIPLYNLIIYFYDLFTYVSRLKILDSEPIEDIFRKIGLLLGVFMVFKLSFTLIQSLIDPSKLNDKENGYGKIMGRAVISIVLLGITPFIFREAMNIQNLVIGNSENGSNFLYRLIVQDNTEVNSSTFGRKLASELFFSFYTKNPNSSWGDLTSHENGDSIDMSYESLREQIEDGSVTFYDLVVKYLHYTDGNGIYLINFDGILCLVAGAITCYLLLSFTVEVSIRIFQLIFLQVIAPIPILSYISDSKGTFQKWIKQCTTTYFDVFIRLSIIYFVVFISSIMMDSKDKWIPVQGGGFLQVLVEFFLIIGLLAFAKKAPNLIKDLFPISSNAASIGYGKLGTDLKDAWSTVKSAGHVANMPLKPFEWGTKKAITAYDRHKYNLPKSRNRLQKWYDNLTPGAAAEQKSINEAEAEAAKWQKEMDEGEKIYNKYRDAKKDENGNVKLDDDGHTIFEDDLSTRAFKNQEYINSFTAVKSANKQYKKDKSVYEEIERRRNAIYSSNLDSRTKDAEIKKFNTVLDQARKNMSASENKLNQAKEKHKINQSKYTDDARVERLFNQYKDNNTKRIDINNIPDMPDLNSNSTRTTQSSSNSSWSTSPTAYDQSVVPEFRINDAINNFDELQNNGVDDPMQLQDAIDEINNAREYSQEVNDNLDDFYESRDDDPSDNSFFNN